MAKLGMKHPVAAKLTETGGVISYSEGMILGKAMTSNTSIETYDVKLYGDDVLQESENGFKSGKTDLQVTDLSDEVQAFLLGHKLVNSEVEGLTEVKEMVANENDEAPFVGFGFYGKKKTGGVVKWRAVWFRKVKFSEPNDENEGQGENLAFHTPTITGTLAKDVGGDWKSEITVANETDAIKWLNTKANITT